MGKLDGKTEWIRSRDKIAFIDKATQSGRIDVHSKIYSVKGIN